MDKLYMQKGERTIYQEGDKVAHPIHGGCVVQGICDRQFKGETKQYYILIPQSEPNTTILDPVENVQRIGLHSIMSPDQADQLFTFAVQAETQWINENAHRREYYAETIKHGQPMDLVRLIKTLQLHAVQTGLNLHDKTALRNAQKKLLSEIALAKGIPFDLAVEMMDEAIRSSFAAVE